MRGWSSNSARRPRAWSDWAEVHLPVRARVLRGEAGGSRWEIATRRPAAHLAPYVRELTGYTEQTPGPLRRRELPTPQAVVILELGPPLQIVEPGEDRRASRHPGGFIAGLSDAATLTAHDGYQRGIQLNLTPIGARLAFGVPMAELTGRVVSFRDLLPREHGSLPERLEELPSWDARLDLVEQTIGARIASARVETRVVSWALRRVEESGGAVDIAALSRELGYSQKHVIHLFRDQVGIPPKLFARLVRFDRLIQRLKSGPPGTWAELAADVGYYDQAHLVRDVRQFAGATPTQVRADLIDLLSLPG